MSVTEPREILAAMRQIFFDTMNPVLNIIKLKPGGEEKLHFMTFQFLIFNLLSKEALQIRVLMSVNFHWAENHPETQNFFEGILKALRKPEEELIRRYWSRFVPRINGYCPPRKEGWPHEKIISECWDYFPILCSDLAQERSVMCFRHEKICEIYDLVESPQCPNFAEKEKMSNFLRERRRRTDRAIWRANMIKLDAFPADLTVFKKRLLGYFGLPVDDLRIFS